MDLNRFCTLEPFLPSSSTSFSRYVQRLKTFLRANKVTDDAQRRDIFQTAIGHETYDLISPKNPTDDDLNFANISTSFNQNCVHVQAAVAVIYETCVNTRMRPATSVQR